MNSSTLFLSAGYGHYISIKSIVLLQIILFGKIKYNSELYVLNLMMLKKLYWQRHIFCSSFSLEKYEGVFICEKLAKKGEF